VKKAKGGIPMPTQEERLEALASNLKQFKTETIKAYGEMAVEMTMVKGLTEDAVKRLASLKDQLEHRFERVDIRFERVDSRLDGVDAHLESMDGRLGRLENLLAQVLARLPEKP
jgi:chromosome segregation ATPase